MICRNKCSFHNELKYVKGKGNKNAELMIIGESPGQLEIEVGEPFVGEAGGLLNYFLRKSGIIKKAKRRYKDIYFTNAVKCYPGLTKNSSDVGTIKTDHKIKCRNHLRKEIGKVKPKIILAMGAAASQVVLGDYGFNVADKNGWWNYSEEFDCHVICAPHTNQILHSWDLTTTMLEIFKKVKHALDHGVPKYALGKHYKTLRGISSIRKYFRKIKRAGKVAWDTETTSLNYWDPKEQLLGWSFCHKPGHAVWIPICKTGEGGRKPMYTKRTLNLIKEAVKDILEDPDIKRFTQNGKFDILWMAKYGIKVASNDWDTQQFHHLVDETSRANLTFLTNYYELNFPRYEEYLSKYIPKKNPKYEMIPLSTLSTYAAADADATFRIYRKQAEIATEKQKKIYQKVSIPISKFTMEMEWNGALVDIKRISKMEKEYDKKIKVESDKLCKLIGRDTMNVASPPQLQKLLYEDFGFEVKFKTKTGNPGTGADVIDYLMKQVKKRSMEYKAMVLIVEIRKMRKMKSTYLTGFRKIVDRLGRLHTSYMTTGTVTGRLSSRAPNLQNIPRDPIFRSLFVAGPGNTLIISDFGQVEARLLAFLADEVTLIRLFATTGFDIHYQNAAAVLKKAIKDVTKEERSKAKNITFGMSYGRSSKSIADEYGLTVEEVDNFINGYFNTYKKIAAYRKKQVKLARRNLQLTNGIGRKRSFASYEWLFSPELDDVRELRTQLRIPSYMLTMLEGNLDRQALNFGIQSYASDLLSMAIDRIRKRIKEAGLEAFATMNVHDCVIFESAQHDAKKVLKIVQEEMTIKKISESGEKMTFSCDAEISPHWVQ